jgi:hypothetical protein
MTTIAIDAFVPRSQADKGAQRGRRAPPAYTDVSRAQPGAGAARLSAVAPSSIRLVLQRQLEPDLTASIDIGEIVLPKAASAREWLRIRCDHVEFVG